MTRHKSHLPSSRRPAFILAMIATLIVCGCGDDSTDPDEGTTPGSTQLSVSTGASSSPLTFIERTAESGFDFTVRNGEEAGEYSIIESLGSGIALLDYDADGALDVMAAGGGEFTTAPGLNGLPSGLFRQTRPWQFEPTTAPALVPFPDFYSHGVIVGDYDADGFSDVLITGYYGLQLLHNCGDGTFIDVTDESGLTATTWSTGAAWADINGDGALDSFVVSYVDWSFDNHPECFFNNQRDVCAPGRFEAQTDQLWLSKGDGTFRNATTESGIVPGGKGLAVLAADADLDGDVDIYVANDTTPNFLYWNDGSGHLTEAGILSGTALGDDSSADGSMGVDIGDWNLDGQPDLWVANFENQTFALYRGQGDGLFEHSSTISGVTSVGQIFVGFGTVMRDFDLDGDEDIVATNGHVMRHSGNSPRQQRPLLFVNDSGKQFIDQASKAGDYFRSGHVGRGLAAGDLDGDGDLDLAVSHTNEPASLLENRTPAGAQAIQVQLVGTKSNRDAVGALVEFDFGEQKRIRLATGGGSYLSSSAATLTFGIPSDGRLRKIVVRWPSGLTETYNYELNRLTLVLIEGPQTAIPRQ